MYTRAEIDIRKRREKQALVDLYSQCGGPMWKKKGKWLTDRPVGEWYGVITNNDGLVTQISLTDNNLTGCLPQSIGDFRDIREVHLWRNQLTGCLPDSIGNWTRVEDISVSSNKLTGYLPESIGNWKRIRNVVLLRNNFTGSLPKSIGNWTDVHDFVISHNKFTGHIPKSIGNWAFVRCVDIGWNKFTGCLPETIRGWNRILYLDIGACCITKLPACANTWTHYHSLRRQTADMVVTRRVRIFREDTLGRSLLSI